MVGGGVRGRFGEVARGVLGAARMHPMAFLQKRGHLCAVARGREMFARVADMTPARFDILYLIHEQVIDAASRARSNTLAQASVPHLLGLRRQTVWKMVERLVELGLVKKTKDMYGPDRRRNVLSLTEEGIRRVRKAYGVAFSESVPLPRSAPTEGEVPRYWRRPELADVRRDMFGQPIPPKKLGREVAKIYTSFAYKQVAQKAPNRRYRYLALLDSMIMQSKALADALGDTSTLIYPVWEPNVRSLPKWATEPARRAEEARRRGWCDAEVIVVSGNRSMPTFEVLSSSTASKTCRAVVRARRKCAWLDPEVRWSSSRDVREEA